MLSALRPHIPPTFVGDDQAVTPRVEAALVQVGRAFGSDRSRFRTRIEASGLNQLGLAFERGRLRVRGDITATMRLLATEHRTELSLCQHRLQQTVSVPCFEAGVPDLCERELSVEVPHPCIESDEVDAEVAAGSLVIGVDVSGEMSSNAPAALSELELTAEVARCDHIEIQGIPAALQRAANVRTMVCEQLQSQGRTVRVGELLDIASHPLLQQARVQRFELESNAEDLKIGIDIDVRLPAQTNPSTVVSASG